MKVIKLNCRYKMFKERGHTVGLKFDTWYKEADVFEAYLKKYMEWIGIMSVGMGITVLDQL